MTSKRPSTPCVSDLMPSSGPSRASPIASQRIAPGQRPGAFAFRREPRSITRFSRLHMSGLGHSRPSWSRPTRALVRCYSNSGQTIAAQRMTRCANSGHRPRTRARQEPPSISPEGFLATNSNQIRRTCFRFLRQPSRPNAPRPVAKSGNVAGSGTATGMSKFAEQQLAISNPPYNPNVKDETRSSDKPRWKAQFEHIERGRLERG